MTTEEVIRGQCNTQRKEHKMGLQVTTKTVGLYGCPTITVKREIEPYDTIMPGTRNGTYVDKKVDLLHQLGYPNVTVDVFADCKSESEIDKRARSIMFS